MRILFCLTILLHAATCSIYDIVISGVFESSITTFNYTQSREYCLSQNAALATLEQVTSAQNTSFQTCRYGWVEEQRILLARTTAIKTCGNSNIGIIKKGPCGYYTAPSAYCYKTNVSFTDVYMVYPPFGNSTMTYSEAMQQCLSFGDSLASKKQLSSTSTPIPDGIPAWSKDNDVVQFSSGKLTVAPCVNKPSQLASAYCFNPNITDFIPVIKGDKLQLKIAIVCIISSIFIILLMAVTFMKGNKCICCVKRKKPAEDSTLERGQGFDTVRGLHRGRIPSYQISGARTKPPVLSQALNTGYSSHYSNHGFESTPETSKQSSAKTYVDHDRYEYSNAAFDNTY